MPDVVAAMSWARKHAPLDALQMCAGLASVRSALGYHADLTETWAWLMAFDRDGLHAAEWATAVAALMSSATAIGADLTGLAQAVAARLPVEHRRARGWLERGAAMVPAYRGDPRRTSARTPTGSSPTRTTSRARSTSAFAPTCSRSPASWTSAIVAWINSGA